MTSLQLYHGGRRWEGPPEIQAALKGRHECGPGTYFTTRYETARRYSKGGGVVILAELDPGIRWLENVELPVASMRDFVLDQPRLRKRSEILDDLKRAALRLKRDVIPAYYLVNLCINHEALTPQNGPAMAAWLVEHGIDASLYSKDASEEWVIVFNPDSILSFKQVKSNDIDWSSPDLPFVKDQLASTGKDDKICLAPATRRPGH